MKVRCHTNLDLSHEKWPTHLEALPRVGDTIESGTKHKNGFQLELEVVAVTWTFNEGSDYDYWLPTIELHMTSWQKRLVSKRKSEGVSDGSITAFYEWYAPLVGKTVGNFI